MENITNPLNGFETILGGLTKQTGSTTIPGSDLEGSMTDEELKQLLDNSTPPPTPGKKTEKTEKAEEVEEEEVEVIDEEEKEEEPVKETKKEKKSTKKEVVEEVVEVEEVDTETEMVSGFFGSMAEKLGWDIEEEEETPKTVEDLIDYFTAVIEEQSTPQYANEEVAALDEFVRNGGDIRKYFEIDAELDLESIDIVDNEINQKAVIKTFLKEKGFNANQIDKKLRKYEDAGLLEDEAQDALESLAEIREESKKKLLIQQQKYAEEVKASQQKLFNSVVDEIKQMDNIRGIKVPQKDKKVLLEYIFKADSNGQTKYQKDYAKNIKNLIESAYFTMKGDTLIETAKKEGSNTALNRFKNHVKNNSGINKRSKKDETIDTSDMWNSITRQLRNVV